MIRHISADSVNDALFKGLTHVAGMGLLEESRNGNVLVSKMPVVTTYNDPRNRVLINERRDANPFFHLFESLWMLAGRNDLAFPQKFVSTFGQFSDDGETLHGAYGYRWRKHFGYDQLAVIIAELRANPKTRRCVLQMWDGGDNETSSDLVLATMGGKDVPCNVTAFFDTIGGKLNLNVMCRSNDIVLGAYGANAVHFSFLLEYVAAMTGIPMGVYRQFSTNFHLYTDLYPTLKFPTKEDINKLAQNVRSSDFYTIPAVGHERQPAPVSRVPLMRPGEADAWHRDLDNFMAMADGKGTMGGTSESTFFKRVVLPMYDVWYAWKRGDFEEARHNTQSIWAEDWRAAAQSWLSIREARRAEKQNV